MSLTRTQYTILAFTAWAALVSAAALPAVVNSLEPVTSLDVYTADWDGTTGVDLERRNGLKAAYFGVAAIFLTNAVSNLCSAAIVTAAGIPLCVAGIATSTLLGLLALLYTVAASKNKRDLGDGSVTWEYPTISSGQTISSNHTSMLDSVVRAYDVEIADGLPVLYGSTACNSTSDPCHKLWYSKSIHKTNNNTLHHVHITPIDHDYRANATETSALKRRQSIYTGTPVSVSDKKGNPYIGGYTWQAADKNTMADIAELDHTTFETDILDQMSAAHTASDKYNTEGVYCMDFTTNEDSAVGTDGFFWIYQDDDDYPTDEESTIIDTCSEQALVKD
ncbi:hypothetical protein LTR85_003412 [Meristemomyces frigidus]|nr:hypothetical protein LTR85_003412 [Meristemomyces frigidus]